MAQENLTPKPDKPANGRFIRNVIVKAFLLFVLLNALFAAANPLPLLGRISAYNLVFPGRVRLPYSENPTQAYSLSLFNLEAMFASHELAGNAKAEDEFRVLLIGDSSTWGFLATPQETLTAYINDADLVTESGKYVRAYNLGYPTISLTKDLLILDHAMQYQPDIIVWLVTLESFPFEKQLFTPLVQNNPERIRSLINEYDLNINPDSDAFVDASFWERTIIGQRRALADLLRFQLYGLMWAATGVDQYISTSYDPPQIDFEADESYYELTPETLSQSSIAVDVLAAGITRAGEVPVLVINEPIFISDGVNSHLRYNFFYPRWAFDAYRQLMENQALANGWFYRDYWNLIPADEFTNSAIHMTPSATAILASEIGKTIQELAESGFQSSTLGSE
ncbi:MAG: SGNH/GDSL hydrolase family protein [Chloroflexi bacterium]|nr:SGNH/GDSL hydrolase family protein [Chloroflexota bacterium]